MSQTLIKVEGMPGLCREAQSGGVINTDREALLAARRLKEQKLAEREKLENLEAKVERLEALLNKLLGDATDG